MKKVIAVVVFGLISVTTTIFGTPQIAGADAR